MPTMAAMASMDRAAMMVWFSPSITTGRAKRQLDLPEQLARRRSRSGAPPRPYRGAHADAVLDIADRRHDGVEHDGDQRRELADLEEHQAGDQEHELRHGLQRIVDRPQDRRDPVAMGAAQRPSAPPISRQSSTASVQR